MTSQHIERSKDSPLEICELINPTPAVAQQLGQLMLHLSNNTDGSPVNLAYLERTAHSENSAQFIARVCDTTTPELQQLAIDYPIVGASTISTLHGVLGEKSWIEDFVVAPDARKYHVAQMIWDEMELWRRRKGLAQLRFNSAPSRGRAHGFYLKNGAHILHEDQTTLFVHTLGLDR